jgi:hypothetical protein
MLLWVDLAVAAEPLMAVAVAVDTPVGMEGVGTAWPRAVVAVLAMLWATTIRLVSETNLAMVK